eukprot:9333486-Pyramimonas_sp.AAC.1
MKQARCKTVTDNCGISSAKTTRLTSRIRVTWRTRGLGARFRNPNRSIEGDRTFLRHPYRNEGRERSYAIPGCVGEVGFRGTDVAC